MVSNSSYFINFFSSSSLDLPKDNTYLKVSQIIAKNTNIYTPKRPHKFLNMTNGPTYIQLLSLKSSFKSNMSSSSTTTLISPPPSPSSTTVFLFCTNLIQIKSQIQALLSQSILPSSIVILWYLTDNLENYDFQSKREYEQMSSLISIIATTENIQKNGRFHLLAQVIFFLNFLNFLYS